MARIPWVDSDECVGCEACVEECPTVFRMGPDEKSEVHDPRGAPEEAIEAAMELCPVECIHWRE